MAINIEPTKDIPMPYSAADDETQTFEDELKVVTNTQNILEHLGMTPELDEDTAGQVAATLKTALETKDKKALNTPAVAYAAKEFVQAYSARLAFEMSDIRVALTNKLMELANCGDPKFELKAIELLGKHSDIALFTERSEVTVNYKTSSDLEEAIKERVKRLLNATTIDVTPMDLNQLDEELGVASPPPKTTQDANPAGIEQNAE